MSAIRIAIAVLFAAVVLQAQMPPAPPGPAMSPEAAVANLEQNQTAQSLSQILRALQASLKVSESVKAIPTEKRI